MFEQTFKNIDDILHKDAGCGSELDYVEQTSWILFLKYLDDFEKDRQIAAELSGKDYSNIIAPEYQWSVWATPKNEAGKIDHHLAITGEDLKDFVDHKLFPYLARNLGKTNPLNENDLADFVALQKTFAESENSWSVDIAGIDQTTFDLSAKNPNKKEEATLRAPKEIYAEIQELDKQSAKILNSIMELI